MRKGYKNSWMWQGDGISGGGYICDDGGSGVGTTNNNCEHGVVFDGVGLSGK